MGVLFLVMAALVWLIRATLQTTSQQRSEFSVLFKILTNHLQLVALVLSFELDWPDTVKTFSALAQPVADVASRIISIDCFVEAGGVETAYVYLLVYLLIPIGVIICSAFFWFIKKRG